MSIKFPLAPEMKELTQWLGCPPRSPLQQNSLNESDAELLSLGQGRTLATTVDSISEEMSVGLYQDPFTMGWVSAQSSLSDLAAVGAKPLGLLFSTQWSKQTSIVEKTKIAQGFQAALLEAGTFLLGGDSGTSESTVLTSVGLGICEKKPMTRFGIQAGDLLGVVGKVGCGPALSFRLLRGEESEQFPEQYYRPQARIHAGVSLAGVARACMDTSDGLLSTLNTLRIINQIGLDLEWNENTLHPRAVEYCKKSGIPSWLLWMGEHGDFQLVVAIPPERLQEAQSLCEELQIIGRATASEGQSVVRVPMGNCTEFKVIEFNIAECIHLAEGVTPYELSNRLKYWTQSLKEKGFP